MARIALMVGAARNTSGDEGGSTLGYFGKLLVGERDTQLDHRYDPPFALWVTRIGIDPSLSMTVRARKRPTTFRAPARLIGQDHFKDA
jgi:hypothetical protein